jgi:hypothetical protein
VNHIDHLTENDQNRNFFRPIPEFSAKKTARRPGWSTPRYPGRVTLPPGIVEPVRLP